MQTSMYSVTVPVMKKGLMALSGLLDKAEAHLKEAGKSEESLLGLRLAPDMFPFVKQVQLVSDQAKAFVARIQGVDPVSMPDTEATIAELKARLIKTIELLDAVKPEEIDGKEGAEVHLPYFKDQHLNGYHYAFEYIIPNFFFHLSIAYALLRADGVEIGKMDYIGSLSLQADA